MLLPAQGDGYRRIWLAGISLGGFASLGMLMRQTDSIEGVLTIAPYLANPSCCGRWLPRAARRPMPRRRNRAAT